MAGRSTNLHRTNTIMNIQFDLLISSYMNNQVGIAPFFLTPQLSAGLRENIRQLQKDGQLATAGIGNNEVKDIHQKMRGDKIYWLDKEHGNKFENQFLEQAQDFIDHLNRTCYTGINACEFHYAVYEKGSFYKRHKDQFRNNDSRKFSLITYLNEDWLTTDGGQLHIYKAETVEYILPASQTAVLFKSDETEHEVAETNRIRMSISGWLKRD